MMLSDSVFLAIGKLQIQLVVAYHSRIATRCFPKTA